MNTTLHDHIGDGELLRRYVTAKDEPAFTALVNRHVDWIYSAARRITSDQSLAEDLTQAVFLALARKAPQSPALLDRPNLGGWLFRAVHFGARAAIRQRQVRKKHEERAMKPEQEIPDDAHAWEEIRGELDKAVAKLAAKNRQAIFLRFYQQKSTSQIASELNITESGAQMRVTRALRQLRNRLQIDKEDLLAGLLSTQIIQCAPINLPAQIVTGSPPANAITISHAIKGMMTMAKAKTLVACAAVVALLASAGLVMQVHGASPATEHASSPLAVKVQQPLAAAWDELEGEDLVSSRAMLTFLHSPTEAIAFFKERLVPLQIDPATVHSLITDLGSSDEKIWNAAFQKLRYQDPRLAIDLETLVNETTALPARTRLIAVLGDRTVENVDDGTPIRLEKFKTRKTTDSLEYNFMTEHASWEAIASIKQLTNRFFSYKRKWTQADRAMEVLAEINTPDALALIKQMTTGHPDADPTVRAKALLEESSHPEIPSDQLWNDMTSSLPIGQTAMLKFAAHPDAAVAYFKPHLLPLTLTRDDADKLITALGSDTYDEWMPAFEKLEYLDPRLAISLPDLMEMYTDQTARVRLVAVMFDSPPDAFQGQHITIQKMHGDKGAVFYDFFSEKGSFGTADKVEDIAARRYAFKKQWTRLVRAELVLGQIATPDAISILKDMATGHPDAIPTRVAREELQAITPPAAGY